MILVSFVLSLDEDNTSNDAGDISSTDGDPSQARSGRIHTELKQPPQTRPKIAPRKTLKKTGKTSDVKVRKNNVIKGETQNTISNGKTGDDKVIDNPTVEDEEEEEEEEQEIIDQPFPIEEDTNSHKDIDDYEPDMNYIIGKCETKY